MITHVVLRLSSSQGDITYEFIIKQITREGLSAAKDPGVALSYGAAFISRGDLAVTGAFMMLWGQQYFLQGVPEDQVMNKVIEAQKVAGSEMMGMTVLGALVGAVLMMTLSDRIGRVTAVCFSSGLASVVYLGVFTVDDPFSAYSKVLLFFMEIAELCAFISSQVLVAQQAPPHLRGAVTGFLGLLAR